jgi:hypothetical protein
MVRDYEFMFNMLNDTLAEGFYRGVMFVHHTESLFNILNNMFCFCLGLEVASLEAVVS